MAIVAIASNAYDDLIRLAAIGSTAIVALSPPETLDLALRHATAEEVHTYIAELGARANDPALHAIAELRALIAREENEATAAPWWAILDPWPGSAPSAADLAGQITGPFLSRQAATEQLEDARHRYGPHAVVYCCSGHRSPEWRRICGGAP